MLRERRLESSPGARVARASDETVQLRRCPQNWQERRNSALQGTGRWGRLLGRLFRLRSEVACQPFSDAALQGDGSIPLTKQLRSDLRARQLVRVRVVHDDLPIA